MPKFPFTNYHELNLDWILKKVTALFDASEENAQTIRTYETRLTVAEQTATSAETAAKAAQQLADDAAENADSALSVAGTADSKADSALTAATNAAGAVAGALTTAQEAQQTAAAAVATANDAAATASSLESLANTANQNATAALETAQTADQKAVAAQTAAATADQKAVAAQTAATTNAGNISTLQTNVSNLNRQISDVESDLEPYIVNIAVPTEPFVHLYMSGGTFNVAGFIYMLPVKVKPNTKYTVMQKAPISNDYHVGTCVAYPVSGGACVERGTTSPMIVTTGANDNYIVIIYYNERKDNSPISPDTLMVAEGEWSEFVNVGEIDTVPAGSVTMNKLGVDVVSAIDSKLSESGYRNIDVANGFGMYSMTRGLINSASTRIATPDFNSLDSVNTLEVIPLNGYFYDIAFYDSASESGYCVQSYWYNIPVAFNVSEFSFFRITLRRSDNGAMNISEGVNVKIRAYSLLASDYPTLPSIKTYTGERISIDPQCKYFNILRNLSMIADTQFPFSTYMQQGAAVYGNYVFLIRHHAKCSVVDLQDYSLVAEFAITDLPDNTHGNSATFGKVFPADNSAFPYLYVGRCSYATDAQAGETEAQLEQCYVLNVTTSGATLAQTIIYMNDDVDYTYGAWDWIVDADRSRIIAVGFANAYNGYPRSYIFKEFVLPDPTNGGTITLHDTDVIEEWQVEDFNMQAFQGGCVYGKNIFIPLSASTNEGVAVYDKYAHRQIAYIQLDRSQTSELQSASVADGKLYVIAAEGRIDEVIF